MPTFPADVLTRINAGRTAPNGQRAATMIANARTELAGAPATVELVTSGGAVIATGSAAPIADLSDKSVKRLRHKLRVVGTADGTPTAMRVKTSGGASITTYSAGTTSGEVRLPQPPDGGDPVRTGMPLDVDVSLNSPSGLDVRVITPVGQPIAQVIVRNRGTSSVTAPRVTFAHAFRAGDVPAGHCVEVANLAGTTAYPTQQDYDNTWKRADAAGSLRMASITTRLDGVTIPAGGTVTLIVRAKNAPPNRVPAVTLDTIRANSNFKVLLQGGNITTHFPNASGVAQSAFNVITLQADRERSPTTLYGLNPTCGWERTRSGPLCVEYEAWEYVRSSAGASGHHKHLKCLWIVRAYSATQYDVEAQLYMDNVNGPGPGTEGTTRPNPDRISFEAFLSNLQVTSDPPLMYIGGTNDPRARVLSGVDVANNRIQFTRDSDGGPFYEAGVPVRFTSTGALPGGISATSRYVTRWEGGGYGLFANWSDAVGGGNKVDILDAGSGAITVVPMCQIGAKGGVYFLDAQGDSLAVGYTRPLVQAETDYTYLSQKSGTVTPCDPSLAVNIPAGFSWKHSPNASVWDQMFYDINGGSDGGDDDRIGWLTPSEVSALMRQFDPAWRQRVKVLSLAWAATGCQYFADARSGTFMNCNAETYPGMPSMADFRAHYTNSAWIQGADATVGCWRYGEEIDGSHLPGFNFGAYLLTGERRFIRAQLAQVTALHAACHKRVDAFGVTGVYQSMVGLGGASTSSQTRGVGWALVRAQQLYATIPDDHAFAAYVRDLIVKHVAVQLRWMREQAPAHQKALGYLTLHDLPSSGGYANVQTFGFYFYGWALGMLRWMDEFPDAHTLWLDYLKKFIADTIDADMGGCMWTANTFYSRVGAPGEPIVSTMNQMFELTFDTGDANAADYPGTRPWACPVGMGFSSQLQSALSNPQAYSAARASCLSTHAAAGDGQAAYLVKRIYDVTNPNFGRFPKYASIVPAL